MERSKENEFSRTNFLTCNYTLPWIPLQPSRSFCIARDGRSRALSDVSMGRTYHLVACAEFRGVRMTLRTRIVSATTAGPFGFRPDGWF